MNRFSSQKMIAMAIFAIVFSVSQVGFGQDAVKEKVDLEIVIKPVGDQMLYETTEFTVTAGSKVRVIMENTATSEAMLHNVVILKPETDKAKIGIAAIQAGADKGYIPVDPAVLFYTEITKPGEKNEVVFTAPEPGDYPYICSFPGHYLMMQGVMHSVAKKDAAK
ncbi:MAG: plastocyanin/azurin family copper-binding protein [Calditrichia bacterium]|nr:hypothetical protein [Calditrichota bacterium]MCB0269067.1 hypothetical protein [Calditrichota bacterium]MCB0286763.1 hypothetical protein [Calditrichota bacterium]MCB9069480.1 hypothetical protein [Calditrichia bacterium]